MSTIIGLLTAMILIAVRWVTSKRPHKEVQPVIVRRFFHPGHSWMRETGDGEVLVGIDEFAQSLIGPIEEVQLPRLLKGLEQGGVAWHVRHGDRTVPILSPVAGRVVAKNEMVLANPSLVNSAPYGDGWLIRVKPFDLSIQTKNLLAGKAAQQWLETVRMRLRQFFAGTPALLLQDGGELVRDLSDKCSAREWDSLVKEFFLTDAIHKS